MRQWTRRCRRGSFDDLVRKVSGAPGSLQRNADDDWAAFRGPVEANDAETVRFLRKASPEDHAKAMIELARYAEMMVATTGFGKDPDEQFPGLRASGMRGSAGPGER